MKSNKPTAPLIGANGNIFNLLSIARQALIKHGEHEHSQRMISEVQQCHSYHEALKIIEKYVEFGGTLDDH